MNKLIPYAQNYLNQSPGLTINLAVTCLTKGSGDKMTTFIGYCDRRVHLRKMQTSLALTFSYAAFPIISPFTFEIEGLGSI